jgi:hypothetical protein
VGGQPLLAQTPSDRAVTINLRDYGWQPPGRHEIDRPSLAIDKQDRVIVGFTVRARPGLATRNQPSLDFHILRFLPDGKRDVSLALPNGNESLPTNAAGKTGIYLSDTNQIIARANGNFQTLVSDADGSPPTTWKVVAPCLSQWCIFAQSPSRKTLLVNSTGADPPLTLIRLSGQSTFQSCGNAHASTEDSIQNHPRSITDEFAYSTESSGSETFSYRWPLCDYEHRIELPLPAHSFPAKVLNDQMFVARRYDNRSDKMGIEVISFSGQSIFRPTLAKHETVPTFPPIQSSERGDRIAADVVTVRGGNQRLDIGWHITSRRIAVYDISARNEVASVPAELKYRYHFEFDLSPDGHRLVILEDDSLRIVDLDQYVKDKP